MAGNQKRAAREACRSRDQLGPYQGQMPDEMRLAILRSQLFRQRLPPAVKQRDMQTSSEQTTACAVEASIISEAMSVSAAASDESRSIGKSFGRGCCRSHSLSLLAA
jgi:hypothetical protein